MLVEGGRANALPQKARIIVRPAVCTGKSVHISRILSRGSESSTPTAKKSARQKEGRYRGRESHGITNEPD